MISLALEGKKLPIHGNGKNVRDWLYVTDHCKAIWKILEGGEVGHTYNIGGNTELSNFEVVLKIIQKISLITGKSQKDYYDLIEFVTDRPGNDLRYAIDNSKMKKLNWFPETNFDKGLEETIKFYFGLRYKLGLKW
jgi:dTDP-glucose 4,6-dehydratase